MITVKSHKRTKFVLSKKEYWKKFLTNCFHLLPANIPVQSLPQLLLIICGLVRVRVRAYVWVGGCVCEQCSL